MILEGEKRTCFLGDIFNMTVTISIKKSIVAMAHNYGYLYFKKAEMLFESHAVDIGFFGFETDRTVKGIGCDAGRF